MLFIVEQSKKIVVSTVPPNCNMRTRKCVRIPNKVLWDVNSLLMEQFQLYEIQLSKQKRAGVNINIRGKTFSGNRELIIRPLDKSFINAEAFNEEEWKKSQVGDIHYYTQDEYEYLRDCYSLQAVNSLSYFATKDLSAILNMLRVEFSQRRFSSKDIAITLAKLLSVYVTISDHEYMDIIVHDNHLKDKIMSRLMLIRNVTLVK